MYNMSAVVQNSTGILGLTQGVSEVLLGGWLGVLLLFGISTVILMSYWYNTDDPSRAIAITSYITLIMAIMLRMMDLLTNGQLLIVLALAALGAIMTPKEK